MIYIFEMEPPIRFSYLVIVSDTESHGGLILAVARTVHDVPVREAGNGSNGNERGRKHIPRCLDVENPWFVVPRKILYNIYIYLYKW